MTSSGVGGPAGIPALLLGEDTGASRGGCSSPGHSPTSLIAVAEADGLDEARNGKKRERMSEKERERERERECVCVCVF